MTKKVTVVVYSGSLHFHDYEFEQDIITIGRRPENDILLKHDGVSGAHARIDLNAMTVTDLNSTNGTFCGGQKIDSVRLEYGKSISIEPYRITVTHHTPKRAARHSDTLVLPLGEFAPQAAEARESNGGVDPSGQSSPRSEEAGWLDDIPSWVPVVVLSVAIGAILIILYMMLSGDS